MNILVIDDHVGTCEALALGLRKLGGHEVATALSPESGLALAKSQSFDVVLLDQRLGEFDGLGMLSTLRQTRSAATAIYVFTAWGTIPDAVEAIRRGAVDYLEKQRIDIEQLVDMFAGPSTPKVPIDPRVRLVITMITANPVLDQEVLASMVNLSVSRLRALFRSDSGVPLRRHQRLARLERSGFLLRTTYRRVSEIARTLDFRDLRRFERLFRRHFGVSPSGYAQLKRPYR